MEGSFPYLCGMTSIAERIFKIRNDEDFNRLAMEIFHLQAEQNPVYAKYLDMLGYKAEAISQPAEIPFLPIEFFKSHRVITGRKEPALVFESSGTTGQLPARHYLVTESLYRESFIRHFTARYGDPADLCILALLPSYLERKNASLVYMMEHLAGISKHPDSGFYLDELDQLQNILVKRNSDGHPALLLGVSFALLDLAEKKPLPLAKNITVMETGGMKGRRKEMIREELHGILKNAFRKTDIHSEYGMTELLSQAYAPKNGIFFPPPWMKVVTRDLYDPQTTLPPGRSGGINIIDLANIWSCSFIATGDVGRVTSDGSFQVTGRFDQAEVRGCNLMVV